MPIKIPNQLPATSVLTSENIFVMTETRASWVSVSILVGIRFSSRICRGRISWVMARVSGTSAMTAPG